MKISSVLLATGAANAQVEYAGTYLRGVTLSISAGDEGRIKVAQTYNFRRDAAGFWDNPPGYTGTSGPARCMDWHIGKKSKNIGTKSKFNRQKYVKAQATFFEPDTNWDPHNWYEPGSTLLADMMRLFRGDSDLVARESDQQGFKQFKIVYRANDMRADAEFENDNWCMGTMEDEFTVPDSNKVSFLFQNRRENDGSPTWMGATSDTVGGIYEKFRFGAALYNIAPRGDTGNINQSPVAELPGEFLMPAGCTSSYTVQTNDPDGDKLKCRWAKFDEATKMIAHNAFTDHGSMTLDEETCTVTYDGGLDKVCVTGTETFKHLGGSSKNQAMKYAGANHCYKAFALIIEDFDADGNVLSSIPWTMFAQVVPKTDNTCPGEDPEVVYHTLDIEKQSAMMEKFITAPAKGEWGINGSMYNKIHLAAKFMDRFTTKFCSWGTMTEQMVNDWHNLDPDQGADLLTNGHTLLETYLVNCKDAVRNKARNKWSSIVRGLNALDARIKAKNEKKGF